MASIVIARGVRGCMDVSPVARSDVGATVRSKAWETGFCAEIRKEQPQILPLCVRMTRRCEGWHEVMVSQVSEARCGGREKGVGFRAALRDADLIAGFGAARLKTCPDASCQVETPC